MDSIASCEREIARCEAAIAELRGRRVRQDGTVTEQPITASMRREIAHFLRRRLEALRRKEHLEGVSR